MEIKSGGFPALSMSDQFEVQFLFKTGAVGPLVRSRCEVWKLAVTHFSNQNQKPRHF